MIEEDLMICMLTSRLGCLQCDISMGLHKETQRGLIMK